MALTHITDTTGTILNRYTLKEDDEEDRTVLLEFNPSADYIAGAKFNAATINPIIDEINEKESDTYVTLGVSTTSWTTSTLESETVYTKELTLTGATSGKHPIVSVLITKPSTADTENEMFSQIIKVQEGTDTLTLTASAVPTTAYTLQVKNY